MFLRHKNLNNKIKCRIIFTDDHSKCHGILSLQDWVNYLNKRKENGHGGEGAGRDQHPDEIPFELRERHILEIGDYSLAKLQGKDIIVVKGIEPVLEEGGIE